MEIESVKHSLQLDEKINLHKTGWVLQRLLWVVLFLFVIAAALGFFGNGPVSKEKLVIKGTKVEFEKYTRYSSETQIKIHSATNDISRISFPLQYTHYFQIEKTIPQPIETKSENGRIEYTFSAMNNSTVIILLKP